MSNFIFSTKDVLFSSANVDTNIAHGLTVRGQPVIPRGYIVVGKSIAGSIYRPMSAAGISPTSFIGGWEFENGGALGTDSGANALHLTPIAGPTQVAGKVGFASSHVAASTQYYLRASEALLQTGDIDYTLAAWVRLASLTGVQLIAAKDHSVAGTREYFFGWEQTSLGFFIRNFKAVDATNATASTGIAGLATNVWYFVVAWHDSVANTINIQVNNGTVISTATTGPQQAASNAEFRVGARQYVANINPWDGLLDQVMYWKRVLTADERTNLYNGGSGLTVAQATTLGVAGEIPWTNTIAMLRASAIGSYRILFYA